VTVRLTLEVVDLATILYQMPNEPSQEGWDAPHAPGAFTFELKTVVELYRSRVAQSLPHIHMHSRRSELFRDYIATVEALAWLERLWHEQYGHDNDDVLPWPERFTGFRSCCAPLLFEKRFQSATCPMCKITYTPEQVKVQAFQHGRDLAAHGGRGLLCPAGHGLYILVEWVS
jgi:hypothetical protein